MNKKILKIFLNICKTEYKLYIAIMAFTILSSIVSSVVPVLMGKIANSIYSEWTYLLMLLCILIILVLMVFIIDNSINYFEVKTCIRIINYLRKKIISKTVSCDYSYINSIENSKCLELCLNDVNAIQNFSVNQIPLFFKQVLSSLISSITLFSISKRMAIILIIINICALIPTYYISNFQNDAAQDFRKFNIKVHEDFLNGIENKHLIQSYAIENSIINKYENSNSLYNHSNIKYRLLNNFYRTFSNVIDAIGPALVLIVGGYSVYTKELTIGEIITATALLPLINTPIHTFSNFLMEYKLFGFKLNNIFQFLTKTDEKNTGYYSIDKIDKIDLNNINIKYNNRWCIKDLSISIESGEKLAIIGKSGVGKTSLLLIISTLMNNYSGEILINGENKNNISLPLLRDKICFLPNDVFIDIGLVDDSLHVSMENFNLKSTAFYKKYYIDKKLNTRKIINGETCLSGGEKKIIGYLKCLFQNADLYLFDEITTGLDESCIQLLLDDINTNFINKTCIFVTHNIDVGKNCDRILFLEEDKHYIGKHSDLLKIQSYKNFTKEWRNKNEKTTI